MSPQQIVDRTLDTKVMYSYRGKGVRQEMQLRDTPYGKFLQDEWNSHYKRRGDTRFLYFIPGNTAIMLHVDVKMWNEYSWDNKAMWYDIGVEALRKLINEYKD